MTSRFLKNVVFAAVGALMLLAPGAAIADTLHLKDGRTLEGYLKSEGDGFVYFVVRIGGIEREMLFSMVDIERIERSDDGSGAADPDPGDANAGMPAPATEPRTEPRADPPVSSTATKVAFLSLEDEVGLYFNKISMEQASEYLKKDEPDVLVLVVNSGGGALIEIEPMSDFIHEELKKDYRVVAWVESAISAACMTTFNCEEIYMTTQGQMGGNVAFRSDGSNAQALEGRELAEVLRLGEKLSRRGSRNPLIMRSMQVFMTLSADIDEYGNVTWYDNDQGEFLVSPQDRILTLNSFDAERYGVSNGTADTKDELLRSMGVTEWVEVGQDADRNIRKFRRNVKDLQERANELLTKWNQAMQLAGNGNEDLSNQGIGRARAVLRQLRGMVNRAPSFKTYTIFTDEWFRDREEELRDLRRP